MFLSLADRDKPGGLVAARRFVELGFSVVATAAPAAYLTDNGVPVDDVGGQGGGSRAAPPSTASPSGEIDLVVNTPRGRGPRADGAYIRTAANVHKVPCLTTVAAALAAAGGIADWAVHGLVRHVAAGVPRPVSSCGWTP